MSSLRQESQSQRHPLIRPINLTSSSDRLAQAPWYQREQLSHAMPDLSPSLTLLLQLPHLDEEVEALVITTGNYLISLSQQLHVITVQVYTAFNSSRTKDNITTKRRRVSHSHLNAGEALRERIINTHSLHLNNSGQRKHNYEHSLASSQ